MEAMISNISGQQRMLVKGKGWLPFHKITWYDSVKTKDGNWMQALEVPQLKTVMEAYIIASGLKKDLQ